MSQKSITNFFKPLQDKRKIVDDFSKNKRIASDSKVVSGFETKAIVLSDKCETILGSKISTSWYKALKNEISKPYFKKLNDFIEQERKANVVYPPIDDVFSWTQYCDIENIKVIILGQDPYHGINQAHGLAFSVKKGVALPPSLVNIFKEVKNCYPNFDIPKHGCLIEWAKQGVLLLNACLTVRAHNANSHANKGWENLTDSTIKYLNSNLKNRVFLLWGSYAQKKGSVINQEKHLVLTSVHPSPLSAHRGFLGCCHFKKANDYLIKNGIKPIDWTKIN